MEAVPSRWFWSQLVGHKFVMLCILPLADSPKINNNNKYCAHIGLIVTSGTELKSEIFYNGVGSEGGTFCVLSRVALQLKICMFYWVVRITTFELAQFRS